MTHAMMVNGRLFERRGRGLAPWLCERGFDAFVLDFRGHGQSVPPNPRVDAWTLDDYATRDIPAAVACIEEALGPKVDLSYFGHSLGGNTGIMFLTRAEVCPFSRLILLTTNVWKLAECEGRWETARRIGTMAFFRSIAKAVGYAPVQSVRMGTDDEPYAYVRQLTSWFFRSRWTDASGDPVYERGLDRVHTPIFAIAGAGDPLCTPRDAEGFLRRLRSAPEQHLRIVGKKAGDPVDADHFQVLTDPRLRGVWEEIRVFLERPVSGAPTRT